jgi:hypothetical protein
MNQLALDEPPHRRTLSFNLAGDPGVHGKTIPNLNLEAQTHVAGT